MNPQHPLAADLPSLLDAMYRFGAGVDQGDAVLLATAFHQSAVIDFTPCGRKLGLDFPLLTGRDSIVGFLSAAHLTQRTSHVITNGRAEQTGNAAELQVLVEATHLLLAKPGSRFRIMNWYTVRLERNGELWAIQHLSIDNIWFDGDPQVLLGK